MKDVQYDPNLDNQLPEAISRVPPALPRDPDKEAAGRARFLVEARQIKKAARIAQPVSPGILPTLQHWAASLENMLAHKERRPMFATVVSIIVSLALLAGGGTVTAYAAQDSLPNDFLYPVKTWQEDLTLTLTSDSQAKIDRLLEYSSERVQEIVALAVLGEPVPVSTVARLYLQNEQAIALVAEMDGGPTVDVITKVQRHIQDQDRAVAATRSTAPEHAKHVMTQTESLLQYQIMLLGEGLEEPAKFVYRWQHRVGVTEEALIEEMTETTAAKEGEAEAPFGAQLQGTPPDEAPGMFGPLPRQEGTDPYGPGSEMGAGSTEELGPFYRKGDSENSKFTQPAPVPTRANNSGATGGSGTQTQSGEPSGSQNGSGNGSKP